MAMRKVTGRLVFANKVNEQDKPIHDVRVQLWDLDVIENDFLADSTTNKNGDFTLSYDSAAAGDSWEGKPELVLRMLEREYKYDKQGQVQSEWKVATSFRAEGDTLVSPYKFGTLRVAFWEYEADKGPDSIAFTPRVAVVDGKVPQEQRSGRTPKDSR